MSKTILTGDDLKKMGIQAGTVYSKILRELLDEKTERPSEITGR